MQLDCITPACTVHCKKKHLQSLRWTFFFIWTLLTFRVLGQSPLNVQLAMGDVFSSPGDSAWVPIYISIPYNTTVASVQLVIAFPSSDISVTDVNSNSCITQNRNWLTVFTIKPDTLKIVMAGEIDISDSGKLVNFQIRVNKSLPALFDVKIVSAVVNTSNTGINLQNGLVASIISGDLNLDGIITLPDIQLLELSLQGNYSLSTISKLCADVDKDGKVTALDLALMVQYLYGNITKLPIDTTIVSLHAKGNFGFNTVEVESETSFTILLKADTLENIFSIEGDIFFLKDKISLKNAILLIDSTNAFQEIKYFNGGLHFRYSGRKRPSSFNDILRIQFTAAKVDYYDITFVDLKNFKINEHPVAGIASSAKIILTPSEASTLFGDVNLDGKINRNDATLLFDYLSEQTDLSPRQKRNASVTPALNLSYLDAAMIIQYDKRILKTLPYSKSVDSLHAIGSIHYSLITRTSSTSVTIPIEIDSAMNILSVEFILDFDDNLLQLEGVDFPGLTESFMFKSSVSKGNCKVAFALTYPYFAQKKIFALLNFSFKNGVISGVGKFKVASLKLNNERIQSEFKVGDIILEPAKENSKFSLMPIFPNPCHSASERLKIRFTLSDDSYCDIKIYSIIGEEIRTLSQGFLPSGFHEVILNPKVLTPGIYAIVLSAGKQQAYGKFVVVN